MPAYANLASAQIVRGRVVLADSTTVARSVVVTAIDGSGAAKARVLTDFAGVYAMDVAPGEYHIRVLRIGYAPTTTHEFVVEAGQPYTVDIVLSSQPVVLSAMAARETDRCGMSADASLRFLPMLEQARAAIAANEIAGTAGELDLLVAKLDGMIDRDGTNFQVDSQALKERIVNRPLWTTPASTLAKQGYVRAIDGDRVVYDVPSANAILSDEFLAGHCFTVRNHASDSGLIGLGFRPIEKRRDITDIDGTMWLNRGTAELQELEFQYVDDGLAGTGCSTIAMCWRSRGGLGAGGTLTFRRALSGEWLVTRWLIRTPSDATEWRRGIGVATLPPNAVARRGRPMVLRPRLEITEGAIGIAWRRGVQVYRDEAIISSIDQLAVKAAGRRPAHVEGRVFDVAGRPIPRVVIEIADPARAALTDSSGFFRIQSLPPKTLKVTVRGEGFQPVVADLPMLRDSTRQVRLTLVRTPIAAKPFP